jgi:putative ABC transport system permease protein
MMESLMQDFRYAMRTMIKYPGFTVIAVLALTLGIGANTALFSVVSAILLRPLPYEIPERLVVVQEKSPKVEAMSVAYPNFLDYRERNHAFEQMVCVRWRGLDLTGVNEPERIENYQVSVGFFETLGIKPAYGRTFVPDEDRPGGQPVVIIGNRLWERQFKSDPDILNKVITLNGIGFTIIGIMPQGFQYPGRAESWTPIGRVAPSLQDRGVHEGLSVVARLKSGTTVQQAQAELDSIAGQLEQQFKQTNEGVGVTATLLTESVVRDIKPSLIVLLGAVGFVLLIACANVANLLLARAASRQKEIAIRLAMGAGRGRIIRQLLTESISMSLLGGVFGVLLAWGAINVLTAITPVTGNIPRLEEVRIDGRVLAFTLFVSIVTGIIFGLVPAVRASKPDLTDSLKEGGRSVAGASRNWLRNLLVVAEVALSLVVLIGGGLMLKGFLRLTNIDPGFKADNVFVMDMALPPSRYADGDHQKGFYDELLRRMQAVSGVQSASVVNPLPITGLGNQISSLQEGVPFARENIVTSDFLVTSPDYFQAMGIPLQKGRNFTQFDNASTPLVIMVDEATAERF